MASRLIKGPNARLEVACAYCHASLRRRPFRPYDGAKINQFFCDRDCKGEWQRAQKLWSKEWLTQKYIVDGLSANDIAKIVGRDSKRVWEWIRDYGIATRPRGSDARQHFTRGHRLNVGVVPTAETRRKISASNIGKPKIPKGEKHHLAGKTGSLHPTWNGGGTPERQAFYGSQEWKVACSAVWSRADARCERCTKDSRGIDRSVEKFHIHHVVSFAVRSLRAVPSNLKLLCASCHRFVHSKKNINKELLGVSPCQSAA